MLSVVLLSLSATFASDDIDTDVIAIDEEITVEEPLAVEEDTSQVSADENNEVLTTSAVVNNTNIKDYIDESGNIKQTVTADELVFNGTFDNLNLTVNRSITLNGEQATLNNPNIQIISSNVLFKGFTINQTSGPTAVFVTGAENYTLSNVTLSGLTIDYIDDASGAGAVAVDVYDTDNLKLIDSVINYVGNTNGYYFNSAVRISNSNNTQITGNRIKAKLVSCPVGWTEFPPGSKEYISSPMSEAISIVDSDNLLFSKNNLNVTLNKFFGDYDTIYTIDIKNSNKANIAENVIVSNGNYYVYGIIIQGNDFNIEKNTINSTGVYYAAGIDVEGPATGVINNNSVDVRAPTTAYGIYSGMNGKNATVCYYNNTITGSAYNIFALSLGDVESLVEENEIYLEGNYTTGIAYRGSKLILNNNRIVLDSSEVGNLDVWEAFGVEAVGVKVNKGNATITKNTISTQGKGISLTDDVNAELEENFINVVGNDDKNAYAIYAIDIPKLTIKNNTVDYQGTTNGTAINNAVLIDNVGNASIISNKFGLDLVSIDILWDANYMPHLFSEGIVVKNTDGVVFNGNDVNVKYTDSVGNYSTIYSLDFINANNAEISQNNITSNGDHYIYGIVVSGNNFTIENNNIVSTGIYYANGIDVEGPAKGMIASNKIVATSGNLSYPIYGAMSNGEVSLDIMDNEINGSGFLVYAIQLGGEEINIIDNEINANGNYTVGIGVYVNEVNINGNNITSIASNVGNASGIWETMGTTSQGILIASGDAVINNNNVNTTADKAIDAGANAVLLKDNDLVAKNATGEKAIEGSNVNEIYESIFIKTILVASDLTKVYGDNNQYVLTVLDENANPVVGKVISVVVDNKTLQGTTDEKGVVKFDMNLDVGNYTVVASYAGSNVYGNKTTTNMVTVTQKPTAFTAPGATILITAVKSGYNYKIVLKDDSGNVLANKSVTITFNGKTSNVVTDANGEISYKLAATKASSYPLTLKFDGDKNYAASTATATIKINKEASKLTAAKKTFKAKVKTKKYTVTLKDSKGKAIKNAKLTLKIKGKTYKAITNAKGKATFKIKKLTKKGKHTAKITFAGNSDYNKVVKSVKITVKK